MSARATAGILGSGSLGVMLALAAGCAFVGPRPAVRRDGAVAAPVEDRWSAPASRIVTPSIRIVHGVTLRRPSGTARSAVARAQPSAEGGPTDRQPARAKRAASIVARSGTAIAERLEVSLAK